ncbi:MAG: hypothetical protein ACOVN0_13685 [Niveispirillum sp.]|uniref:hypothetical protein n=1 Tax=Niveispirillum sp. TaxID=1917217 RepID=UPI003BA7B524
MTDNSTIPTLAAPADIDQTLESLLSLLTGGEETLAGGEMVDLYGLEREVKPILDAILSLPAPQARALLPKLEQVLAALDRVAGTLERVHGDKLGGRETHATRIRAAQAYRSGKDM